MVKRTTIKCRRGATAVEFAVVSPILFAFILGFIAMGQMVTVQQILIHAAREGCRKAALSTTMSETDVENVAKDYLRRGAIRSDVIDAVNVDVFVADVLVADAAPLLPNDSETEIRVELDIAYADVCWVPITFFGYLSNVTLGGTCTMERE